MKKIINYVFNIYKHILNKFINLFKKEKMSNIQQKLNEYSIKIQNLSSKVSEIEALNSSENNGKEQLKNILLDNIADIINDISLLTKEIRKI